MDAAEFRRARARQMTEDELLRDVRQMARTLGWTLAGAVVKRRNGSVPEQREKAQWGTTCPDCGKVRYLSRRHARARARVIKDGTHMNAYRCGEFWHLGRLPHSVRTGRIARDDLGGRP